MKRFVVLLLAVVALASCSEISEEQKAKNDEFIAKNECTVNEKKTIMKCSAFENKDPIGYKGFRVLNDEYFSWDGQIFKLVSDKKFKLINIMFRKVNDIDYDHGLDWETFVYVWGDIVKDKEGVYLVNSPVDERPKKIIWADAATFEMWEDGTFQDKNQWYDKDLNPIKR